jgi:hypothetical protein
VKRYRLELTERELECLFIVADEGCERAREGEILSMGEGFTENMRAALRARGKLVALIEQRDAADRADEVARAARMQPVEGRDFDLMSGAREMDSARRGRVISGTGDTGEQRELRALVRGLRSGD